MNNQNKNVSLLIEKLVNGLLSPLERSETFINNLKVHLNLNNKPLKVDPYLNELLLKEKSKDALELYKRMSEQNSRVDKNILDNLIYIFLNLSSSSLSIEEELKINLKKGALGFEISYFNPIKIYSL